MVHPAMKKPVLMLGRLLSTPGALQALAEAGESAATYLKRHECGDWGEVCPEDWKLNDEALKDGSRVLSSYKLKSGKKIWIITEADRAATTILQPEEY